MIIIDKDTVITGSFKLTKEAEDRNAENMMIVRAAAVADSYRENWEQHKAHAETFKPGPPAQARQEPVGEKKIVKKKRRTN